MNDTTELAVLQVVLIGEPLSAPAVGNIRIGVCPTLDPVPRRDPKKLTNDCESVEFRAGEKRWRILGISDHLGIVIGIYS